MQKTFHTLIKKDHKFGQNDYVIGRIAGYKELMCDGVRNGIDEPGFGIRRNPDIGELHTTCCEPEQYEIFKNHVEKYYPGLCEFYYGENKEG